MTLQPPSDRFNLQRFIKEQDAFYTQVLSELHVGAKRGHWMWFIFPQIDGLGFSPTAKRYAIKSLEEARAYLRHPVLGGRLMQCTELVLSHKGLSPSAIFPFPDDLKLRSCMTLFSRVAEPGSVFEKVLDAFFQGQRDEKTLELLKRS